ncbi:MULTISPECIES: hypothetical protein [unclassified Microcoleus]|uniref:hypothetical protein n=1 Tax=unclassified Microcoleus TaxID=2642155 RepID=UPI002FD38AD5
MHEKVDRAFAEKSIAHLPKSRSTKTSYIQTDEEAEKPGFSRQDALQPTDSQKPGFWESQRVNLVKKSIAHLPKSRSPDRTKTLCICRRSPRLLPPKSPLRRGTLSASCPPLL